MIKVFEGNLWEAQLIKGLLESNEIDSMIEDDTMGAITSPYLNAGGDVKVLVNDDDVERAKLVIAERKE